MALVARSLMQCSFSDHDLATLLETKLKLFSSETLEEDDDLQEPAAKRRKVEDRRQISEQQEAKVNRHKLESLWFAEEQEPMTKRRRLLEGSPSAEEEQIAEGGELKSALRVIPKRLNLCSSYLKELDRLRREHTQTLLREKKLILILDLDHTLLDSISISDLSPAEEYSRKDIFLYDDHVTKLRPNVRTFLQEASKMFKTYLSTMEGRAYSMSMVEILDPRGFYFKSKVLSQEELTGPNQKGLDVVLGEERTAMILDGTQNVWERHQTNLILMERYSFFAHGHHRRFNLKGRSLSKLKKGV